MSDTVTIYGASDDLIEIEGSILEEFPLMSGDGGNLLAFSDGTLLEVMFTNAGMWRIDVLSKGRAQVTKEEATDMDTDYSDQVTLTGDILWVVHAGAIARRQ